MKSVNQIPDHAAGHVLSVTRITLDHHACWFEDGVGDFRDRQLLVVGLLSGDDRGIRCQHEVNTWVGHQIGLEFRNIDVQSTIESQTLCQGGNNLRDKSV